MSKVCNKCGSRGPLVWRDKRHLIVRPLCLKCQAKIYKLRYASRKKVWLESKRVRSRKIWRLDPVRSREKVLSYRSNLVKAVHQYLGSKCSVCGEADPSVLQIDHIFGGGEDERREGLLGPALYRAILRGDRDGELQLMCANCHRIKSKEDLKAKAKPGQASAVRRSKAKLRLKALIILGAICNKCGFSDNRALEIDHVQGDGAKERKIRQKLGSKYLVRLVLSATTEEIKSYQLLCSNCNWRKRMLSKHEHSSG